MSWPLSCGVGRNIEAEKRAAAKKFLPRRSRIPRQMASFKRRLAAQRTCPGLSCGVGRVVGAEKGTGQKFPTAAR